MRSNQRQNRSGAALLYALVTVLVISVLVLGVGRLVAHHFQLESTAQSYARAIYIAEAAANWQLSRMSRADLPDTPPESSAAVGRIPASQLDLVPGNEALFYDSNLSDAPNALPVADTGIPLLGRSRTLVTEIDGTTEWRPGRGDFILYAEGQEPTTGIRRSLFFRGTGTALSERYLFFGVNGLRFEAVVSSNPPKTAVCRIISGYIGSNGEISYSNAPPNASPPPLGQFGGCRLGPTGTLAPPGSAWPSSWDVPRLPTPVLWPTVAEIVRFTTAGRTPDQLAVENDNARISYKTADGSYVDFSPAPTKLTDAEFSQSNYTRPGNPAQLQRTIRLRAVYSSSTKNKFYFTNIQMGPNDVLVLDYRGPSPEDVNNRQTEATGLTILINNPNVTEATVKVTNLAYFDSTNTMTPDPNYPTFLWLNNTNRPLEFAPNPEILGPIDTHPDYQYVLHLPGALPDSPPAILGMIYGVNSGSLPGNEAGDVIIRGNNEKGPDVQGSIVANHLRLIGEMNAAFRAVEDPANPRRYILYYRVTNNYMETRAFRDVVPRSSVIGYGRYRP